MSALIGKVLKVDECGEYEYRVHINNYKRPKLLFIGAKLWEICGKLEEGDYVAVFGEEWPNYNCHFRVDDYFIINSKKVRNILK
jgi:hypothetical protein